MVLVANGGLRTPSGTLAHFLAYRSDYLRPPLSPARPQPRSSLSLRVDSREADAPRVPPPRPPHSRSVHTLRRPSRARSPISPVSPISPISPASPVHALRASRARSPVFAHTRYHPSSFDMHTLQRVPRVRSPVSPVSQRDVHTLRRVARTRSPASPASPLSPPEPISPEEPACDCLPTDPIPPPELFDF